jgi:hypothetical protein
MTVFRAVPLSLHGALEVLAAPAIVAAPLALGLGEATSVVAFVIGVVLLGHALSIYGDGRRTVPLSAHAGFDYLLAIAAMVSGVAIGIATGDGAATGFLVGVGVAQLALTASTRFSVPRGA